VANSWEILSVLAVCTVAVYAGIEFASRDSRIEVFILLPVFLFQYTSSVFLSGSVGLADSVQRLAAPPGWARLHVVPAILAYSGFTIAAVYGALHLRARSNLKHRKFGLLFDRLPSLEVLGRMVWYALVAGFAFMTIAVITGGVMSYALAGQGGVDISALQVAVMAVIGTAVWVAYLAAILGRSLWKWPESRVSLIAVNGFLALILLLAVSIFMP
jgi:ABC-type uncharacterized transport system permease subunit